MGFLTSFLAATPENPSFNLNSPEAWDAFVGGEKSDAGLTINRETALSYSPWWRGIDLISGSVAKVPCFVYQRTQPAGKRRATEHSAFRLLRRKPNDRMTALDWMKLMVAHKLSEGNGYSHIARLGDATPTELWPLDPTRVTPVLEKAGDVAQLWYVVRLPSGESRKLRPENMLHFKGLSFDGLVGYTVLSKARETLSHGIAARKYATVVFKNSGRPSVVLTFPSKLDDKAKKEIVSGWERMHAGLDNAHRTALLDMGLELKEISFNPNDAQLVESREFSIRDIANYLGVPAHKIGDTSRTAYSSLEQENQSFIDDTLDLHMAGIESECWDKLLTEDEKNADTHYVEFHRQALVRGDMETRAAYFRTALGGRPWMVPDEVRDEENMNPLGGEASTYLNPLNMGQGGADNEPKDPRRPPPPKGPGPKERPVKERGPKSQEPFVRDVVSRMVRRVGAQAAKAAEKPATFTDWVDGFSASNRLAFRDACSSVEQAIAATGTRCPPGELAGYLLATFELEVKGLAEGASHKNLAEKTQEAFARMERDMPAETVAIYLGGDSDEELRHAD